MVYSFILSVSRSVSECLGDVGLNNLSRKYYYFLNFSRTVVSIVISVYTALTVV